MIDKNPTYIGPTTDSGDAGVLKGRDNSDIKVARAWSVVQPSSMDLRADCLIKEINSRSSGTTTTTGDNSGSTVAGGNADTSTTSSTSTSETTTTKQDNEAKASGST